MYFPSSLFSFNLRAYFFPSRRARTYNRRRYSKHLYGVKVSRSCGHVLEMGLTVLEMCAWPSLSERPQPALLERLSIYHFSDEVRQKGNTFNKKVNLPTHLGRRKTALLED